jgi:hypothetical protein
MLRESGFSRWILGTLAATHDLPLNTSGAQAHKISLQRTAGLKACSTPLVLAAGLGLTNSFIYDIVY